MANDKNFKIKNGLALDDNKKIELGDSADLQIYHDGSHSYVKDAGTGNLNLQGENVAIENTSGVNYFVGIHGGASNVYHSGSLKLATTSTGIDVTGNVSATGDIILEGSTADDFETTVTVTDPTADQTFTIPDQTGTAMLWQQPWPDDPALDGNIAIGEGALSSITSSERRNIAIGENALQDCTTDKIIAIGAYSLANVTSGDRNLAIGDRAGIAITAASDNTLVGYEANQGGTGGYNTCFGSSSGYNLSSSSYTTNIGYQAGYESGSYSVNVGYRAGFNTAMNSGAVGHVLIGYATGDTIRTGDYNVLVGYAADTVSTSSVTNVGIGKFITCGNSNNVNIGNQHYQSSTADRNVAIGLYSGGENSTTATTGDDNVGIGYYAGRYVQANNNVFIGREAGGTGQKTGSSNMGIGYRCLQDVSSGDSNIAIGYSSGRETTTGGSNAYLGAIAGGSGSGGHTTGSNCSFLGYNSVPSASTVSNQITLGDSNITSLRCNVTTISSLSDERDKTDIEDLPYGLDFINDMRPVQFTWDRRDGSMNNVSDLGFIAQDLHDVELEHSSTNRTRLVKWDNPDKLEADYVRSYPILVKAVQELSAKCDALEARLAALEGV